MRYNSATKVRIFTKASYYQNNTNMKKATIIVLSILLAACNGNYSVKSQSTTDTDSTDCTVIDTMVTPAPEKEAISKKPKKAKTKSPIVGTFYCKRSGDSYVFNNDYTGMFIPNGGYGATYYWSLKNNTIVITYSGESEFLGTTKLKYDKKSNTFVEKSSMLGNLKFTKQH